MGPNAANDVTLKHENKKEINGGVIGLN